MAVRAFIQLRQLGTINANLAIKIAELEDKYGKHDFQIQKIIRILRKLLEPPVEPQEPEKPPIGFRV
jgi:CCR4-NOT transcriptional regulation complex NOT5 subunit